MAQQTITGGAPATPQSTHQKIDANFTELYDRVSWAIGADVASASTLALGAGANYFDVTGTTTITAITSDEILVKLHFDGALTLTHNATSLILPGGANITTAAGDEAEFFQYSSGNWRCVNYQRAADIPGATTLEYATESSLSLSGESYIEIIPSPGKETWISGYLLGSADAGLKLLFYNGANPAGVFNGYSHATISGGATTIDFRSLADYLFMSGNTPMKSGYTQYINLTIKDLQKIESAHYGNTSTPTYHSCYAAGYTNGTWDRVRIQPSSGNLSGGAITVKEIG